MNDICKTNFEFYQIQQLLIDPKSFLPMYFLNPTPRPVIHPVPNPVPLMLRFQNIPKLLLFPLVRY